MVGMLGRVWVGKGTMVAPLRKAWFSRVSCRMASSERARLAPIRRPPWPPAANAARPRPGGPPAPTGHRSVLWARQGHPPAATGASGCRSRGRGRGRASRPGPIPCGHAHPRSTETGQYTARPECPLEIECGSIPRALTIPAPGGGSSGSSNTVSAECSHSRSPVRTIESAYAAFRAAHLPRKACLGISFASKPRSPRFRHSRYDLGGSHFTSRFGPVCDTSAGTCRTMLPPAPRRQGDHAAAVRCRTGLARTRSCSIAHR